MEKVIKELKRLKAKKILVQFPEGLKLKIQEIVEKLETQGFEVFLCLERTYGACDIRDEEALRLKCDAILHIGHSSLNLKSKLPIVYWHYYLDANPLKILQKEFHKLKNYEKIGLVYVIQFLPQVKKIKEFLEKNGKRVITVNQVLGCRLDWVKKIESKVDVFICIAAGKFHALGLALKTKKPVLNLDLEKNRLEKVETRKYLKIKNWNKSLLKDAKKIGFLISWKKGQFFENWERLKRKLEKEGKKVYLLVMDEIDESKLEGLRLDLLINFACPRIAIDDISKFKIPILNWDEI